MNLLLSGVTGFIGGGVYAKLIEEGKFQTIYVLLRGSKDKPAEERLDELITNLIPPHQQKKARERTKLVAGDLTAPRLGIDNATREHLTQTIHQVAHVSASTQFDAPLDELRKTNCEGTRELLELAKAAKENGQFERFDFVSTAYVAGRKPGDVTEDNLDRGQAFSNNYEQSKFEAETVARSYRDLFPVTMIRPSIVVGRSDNGYTPHFRVLYWPIKLVAKKLIYVIPCRDQALLDVVPSDYVINGTCAIIQSDKTKNETYHLTSGKGNEVSVKGLLKQAEDYGLIPWRPKIPFWVFHAIKYSPARFLLPKKFWEMSRKAEPYSNYLMGNGVRYLDGKTVSLLQELGVQKPKWSEFYRNIFDYVDETNWGKNIRDNECDLIAGKSLTKRRKTSKSTGAPLSRTPIKLST